MSENFQLEIISPDQTVLKTETTKVIIPAFEGLMTILKDHIPIVTFMRPGFIEVEVITGSEKFFIEEGTVEFNNNTLLILSSTVLNVKDLSGDRINEILKQSNEAIKKQAINDKEKYILSYKINALKEINKQILWFR